MTIVQVIIPVMIVVFLAIAPPVAHHQFNATCPPFREIAEGEHNVERRTQAGDVPYFVRADFGATIAADPAALRLVEAAADSLHRTSPAASATARVWQHRVDSRAAGPRGVSATPRWRRHSARRRRRASSPGALRRDAPMAEAFKSKEQRAAGARRPGGGTGFSRRAATETLGTQRKGKRGGGAASAGEAEPTEGVGAAGDSAQPDVLGEPPWLARGRAAERDSSGCLTVTPTHELGTLITVID